MIVRTGLGLTDQTALANGSDDTYISLSMSACSRPNAGRHHHCSSSRSEFGKIGGVWSWIGQERRHFARHL
jgi:hypothetical protein